MSVSLEEAWFQGALFCLLYWQRIGIINDKEQQKSRATDESRK